MTIDFLTAILLVGALGLSWPRFLTMFDSGFAIAESDGVWISLATAVCLGAAGLAVRTYGAQGGVLLCGAGIALGHLALGARLNRVVATLVSGTCLAVFMAATGAQATHLIG